MMIEQAHVNGTLGCTLTRVEEKLAVCRACDEHTIGGNPCWRGDDCLYFWPADAKCGEAGRQRSGFLPALLELPQPEGNPPVDQCECWDQPANAKAG